MTTEQRGVGEVEAGPVEKIALCIAHPERYTSYPESSAAVDNVVSLAFQDARRIDRTLAAYREALISAHSYAGAVYRMAEHTPKVVDWKSIAEAAKANELLLRTALHHDLSQPAREE